MLRLKIVNVADAERIASHLASCGRNLSWLASANLGAKTMYQARLSNVTDAECGEVRPGDGE